MKDLFAIKALFLLALVVAPLLLHGQTQPGPVVPVARPPTPSADYVLGAGDLIGVVVYGDMELSRDVRISGDGYIWLPLLKDKIKAGGMTVEQLQNRIAELYAAQRILKDPNPMVTVKEYKSSPVIMVGAFQRSMIIQIVGRTTLLQAISQSEGLHPSVGPYLIVTRHGSAANAAPENFTIRIKDLMEHADDPRVNIELQAGDVVSAPRGEQIYVGGAVTKPGALGLNENSNWTVLQAITAVGNPLRTAKLDKAVIVRKQADGTTVELPIDLKKVMERKAPDTPLVANDVLLVPESAGRRALLRAADTLIAFGTGASVITLSRR